MNSFQQKFVCAIKLFQFFFRMIMKSSSRREKKIQENKQFQ
jgi:hypothetical protein